MQVNKDSAEKDEKRAVAQKDGVQKVQEKNEQKVGALETEQGGSAVGKVTEKSGQEDANENVPEELSFRDTNGNDPEELSLKDVAENVQEKDEEDAEDPADNSVFAHKRQYSKEDVQRGLKEAAERIQKAAEDEKLKKNPVVDSATAVQERRGVAEGTK